MDSLDDILKKKDYSILFVENNDWLWHGDNKLCSHNSGYHVSLAVSGLNS